MAFIDLNKDQSFVFPESDIIIIGAGAAGILLSVNLSRQGKKVLMFETGHYGEDPSRQSLNEVQQTGKILNNSVWGRKRAIGGTTIAWGGQSLPFTPLDFAKKEWLVNSGWPVSYEEVKPWYNAANEFMKIDTLNYTTDIFPKIGLNDAGIDKDVFDLHVSKWAAEPDFYKLYKEELSSGVTVVYNANVTRIHKENDRVTSVTVTSFEKVSYYVPVKKLVIAAGTIETVRLLLCNKLSSSSWLGRCFMEHPCIEAGTIHTNRQFRLQRLFNTHTWRGNKYSVRLSLTSKFQAEQQLANCSASIMFMLPADMFDPYGELKSFRKDFKIKRLLKISGSFGSMVKSGWAYLMQHFFYKAHAVPTLALMIEQEPCKESFIGINDQPDVFGVPQAVINWTISKRSWETAVVTANKLKDEFESLGLGKVELAPAMHNDNWQQSLSDVCHHMGGCRMSREEEQGVVDTDLKVWGTDNLYLASCAVFPTSSHSNPTLTMLALTARLASHLNLN